MEAGDQLLRRGGGMALVEAVGVGPFHEVVYNFLVAELQCYSVGEAGFLVHNGCPEGKNSIERQIQRLKEMEAQPVDPEAAAADLGYRPTNYRSHGQPVYYNPETGTYITPDVDSHSGGVWKAADSVENLGSKKNALGNI